MVWGKTRTKERMVLQGFPATILKDASAALRAQASGNAYPVPLIIAVAHPMLNMVGPTLRAEKNFKPAPLETQNALEICEKFEKCMAATKEKAENTTPKTGLKRSSAAKKTVPKKKAKAKSKGLKTKKEVKISKAMKAMKASHEKHEEEQSSGGIQVSFVLLFMI